MMAGRFTAILFTFILGLFALIFTIRSVSFQRSMDQQSQVQKNLTEHSDFAHAHYYLVNTGKPVIFLMADTLRIINNNFMDLTMPKGEAFSAEGIPIYYQAKIGNFDKTKEVMHMTQDVNIDYKTMKIQSYKANYFKKDDRFEAFQDVMTSQVSEKTGDKLTIWSDQAVAWPQKEFARYTGRVRGQVDKKKAYEEGIAFKSDMLEADMKANLVTLTNNVWLKKQDLTATSIRGEVFLENYNKKLKYYVLYDDVKLEQKVKNPDGSILVRKGFCEKLEGQMVTETAILTGAPKIISGTDVVTGNKITLRERAQLIEVEDNKSSLIIKKGFN